MAKVQLLVKNEERKGKNFIEYVEEHKNEAPSNSPKGREQNQPFLVPSPLGESEGAEVGDGYGM
ncbi:MAG: hypothetical protein IJ013_10170 [Bacteroidaceae bacterium]|nr:hypothetical protein [Bacteroidaceae bacterium]